MKKTICVFFLLMIIFSLSSFAQNEKREFICKTDSIINFKLKELRGYQIDTIILLQYRYDNGFLNDNVDYLIWQKNDSISMFKVQGHDSIIISDYSNCRFSEAFDYFFKRDIDTITTRVKYPFWQSHDMGYNIVFLFGTRLFRFSISDYQRCGDLDLFQLQLSKDDPEYGYLFDPRIVWINMIDDMIKKY